MAYDTSISVDISLSKILDQMILDGTELDVVKAFLSKNRSHVSEIFGESAFVYELYDIVANPGWFRDPFFLDNFKHLSPVDSFYAYATGMLHVIEYGMDRTPFVRLKEEMKLMKTLTDFHITRMFRGSTFDKNVLFPELIDDQSRFKDINGIMEHVCKDNRDFETFARNAYSFRHVMMYDVFSTLGPCEQLCMVRYLTNYIGNASSTRRSSYYFYPHNPVSECVYDVMVHVLVSLLKQMLAMNDVSLFDWVVSIIGLTPSSVGEIANGLIDRFPCQIKEQFNDRKSPPSLEDVVFDMNMYDTIFDSTDLFIYIYVCNGAMRKDLAENQDLMDFFNPVFDWQKLEYLK